MEAKHTPGPWYIINGWDSNGHGQFFPALVFSPTENGGTLDKNAIIINASHDNKAESLMANARLIASAPELLEACGDALDELQKWAEAFSEDEDTPKVIATLKAVIRKATQPVKP